MNSSDIKALLGAMRFPFLILTPSSIFLAYAVSLTLQNQVSLIDTLLVLTGALAAHISVNTLNEYCDFRSGLDFETVRTPFSGGSGALIASPKALNAVLYTAMISLAITVIIGLYFILSTGWLILPIGIIGILIIVTYTQWINYQPFLCLIAPGAAFGVLMVLGTSIVLNGHYSGKAFFVSLLPFFLVNNLLLLNQYPDITADKRIGRKHFPIVYGVQKSTLIYGLFSLAAVMLIVTGVTIKILPALSYISLITLLLCFVVFFGTRKYAENIKKLTPYLGLNVFITIFTPVLLGLSLIYG